MLVSLTVKKIHWKEANQQLIDQEQVLPAQPEPDIKFKLKLICPLSAVGFAA